MGTGRSQKGVMLTEAAAVLAVIAVLTATAAPAMRGWVDRQRLRGSADTLRADLQQLRSQAVQRGQTLWLTVHHDRGGSCYVTHSGPRDACRCHSAQVEATCDDTGQALKVVRLGSDQPVRLTSSSAALAFEPLRGIATPAASYQLSLPSGEAVHQVVSVMGRVRSCTPKGLMPGLPVC